MSSVAGGIIAVLMWIVLAGTAHGSQGLSALQAAANGRPSAVPQALIVLPGTVTSVSLVGFDVDEDPLVFSILSVPVSGSLGALDPIEGTTAYSAPAFPMPEQDSFAFSVDDGIVSADATVTIFADNDGDGSPDVDENEMGTDPMDSDTDDDGLLDGVETNWGDYTSPTDTGTSPLAVDTDGDGANDGLEVQLGTDPTDPASTPGAEVPSVSWLGIAFLASSFVVLSHYYSATRRDRERCHGWL